MEKKYGNKIIVLPVTSYLGWEVFGKGIPGISFLGKLIDII